MRPARTFVSVLLAALFVFAQSPGFRTPRALDEHYAKRSRDFGNISKPLSSRCFVIKYIL